jgi:DNA polymerase-3 subunit delta
VADVARYDVFQLSEAWLAGDAVRVLRILSVLQDEGDAPTLAVWQLSEDVHALASVQTMVRSGASVGSAVKSARVWGRRQSALEHAANRVPVALMPDLLLALARLDALAKGLGRGNPWEELATTALALAGRPALPLSGVLAPRA